MADKVTRQPPETGPNPPLSTHPVITLRDEVDRLFDGFFPAAFGSFLPLAFGRSLFDTAPIRDRVFAPMGEVVPSVDVKECGDHYEIAAELPGLDDKDVSVSVDHGVLCIAGEKRVERKEDKESLQMSERAYGSFTRRFRLPEEADRDAIGADFAKGVLTVTIGKRLAAAKGEKKIEIKHH